MSEIVSGAIDIGAKSYVQANWGHNSPTNENLRRIVEPLAKHFDYEMICVLDAASTEERQEMLRGVGNVYLLPYGRIGMLPPALFGDISEEDIVLRRPLTVPEDGKEVDSMVSSYMRWAQDLVPRYKWSATPNSGILTQKLVEFGGMEYPGGKWEDSARQMQHHLTQDPMFVMDTHRVNRIQNAGYDYDQLSDATKVTHRQSQRYALVMSRTIPEDGPPQGTRDYVQLPVGEYGADAAGKLARLTVFAGDFIKGSIMIDAGVRSRLTPTEVETLREHTARTRERYQDNVEEDAVHGVKNTLTEGILSMSQIIAYLTIEKVPGYEDHDQLVRAILDSDVIEQFTRSVPPGYIGPAILSGLYAKGALVERNGKLSLSKDALRTFSAMRKEYLSNIAAQWATYRASGKASEKPDVLGLVCPAAAPSGAITTCRGVFRAFYGDTEVSGQS